MEKIEFDIYLSADSDISSFDKKTRISFENINDLRKFNENITDYIDYEKSLSVIRDMVYISEDGYFVDENNEMVDDVELEDVDLYNYHIRTNDELEELYNEEVKAFNIYYDKLKNGEYVFKNLTINFTWKYKDIKEAIILLKDKVETINMENLTLDEITDLVNTVDFSDNVNINTIYNYNDTCTISELRELVTYLNNIKNYINRYNLSPLEICIFVNDLIKERRYKKNDNEIVFNENMTEAEQAEYFEKSSYSRSLIKVFKSDEIVCAGFSNLYKAILDLFGINSEKVIYLPKTENVNGHMSNLIYLDDPKYMVSGIYEVDTTWGRKENEDKSYNYQESVNNYFHFARSLDEAAAIKDINNQKLVSDHLAVNNLMVNVKRFQKLLELGAPSPLILTNIDLILRKCFAVNELMKFNYLETEVNKLNELKEKVTNGLPYTVDDFYIIFVKLYNKTRNSRISHDAFKNALYRVKLLEHSIDKDKYPFDQHIFNKALDTRMDNEKTKLLKAIFGLVETEELSEEDNRDIARSEFISVLHKMAEDNVDKNPVHHI